jgi:hypothetical protein
LPGKIVFAKATASSSAPGHGTANYWIREYSTDMSERLVKSIVNPGERPESEQIRWRWPWRSAAQQMPVSRWCADQHDRYDRAMEY